jgi:hypothetical protein
MPDQYGDVTKQLEKMGLAKQWHVVEPVPGDLRDIIWIQNSKEGLDSRFDLSPAESDDLSDNEKQTRIRNAIENARKRTAGSEEIDRCALCGWDAKVNRSGDADHIVCELCGEFKITQTLLASLVNQDAKPLLPYLRAHTRQASERGELVTLDTRNWKDLALAHKYTPLPRKITKLLELLASRSRPGDSVEINPAADAPLVDAASKTEMLFLIDYLEKGEYVRKFDVGSLDGKIERQYILEVKGWEQLQPTAGIPGKCFVAMSFNESLKEAYDNGIYLALKEDCKMDPVRIDLVPHNENIVDKIIAEIRTCQFMVADFTGHRAGVYFEAGFARGLGRPVIWTCREDDFENRHFDTAQFSHIVWKDPADLRMQLADRIKATILP